MKSPLIPALSFALAIAASSIVPRCSVAAPGAPSAASVKDKEVVKAAEFAITAQQKAIKDAGKNEKLALVKIVSATNQVVAGMNYRLTLEVKVDGKSKTAEAVVWEQAWRKEPYKLTSWNLIRDASDKDGKPTN